MSMSSRRAAGLLVCVALATLPVSQAAADPLAPADPLGTPYWLPADANEASDVPSGSDRLVVPYRRLLAEGDDAILAGGPFIARFSAFLPGSGALDGVSPRLSRVVERNGGQIPGFLLDHVAAAVQGDVRDGDCDLLGTPRFSYAYSTTRVVTGPAPAEAGRCETVDAVSSDGDSFETTITTYVPGFWVDLGFWQRSSLSDPALSEVFYAAVYDSNGDESMDAEGRSRVTSGRPSTAVPPPPPPPPAPVADHRLHFEAAPGAFSDPCPRALYARDVIERAHEGSWSETTLEVPLGTGQVTFEMATLGPWSLRIVDPAGRVVDQYTEGGFPARPTIPSETLPDLIPGTFLVRACNIAGEPAADVDVYFD